MTKYKCERTYIDRHIDRRCKRAGHWKMMCRFLAVTALGSLLLTGCGAKVDVPDMSSMGTINVVSREEGSGTKTEFDNIVGADATGTNTVADSTDKVISEVASDKNAIVI